MALTLQPQVAFSQQLISVKNAGNLQQMVAPEEKEKQEFSKRLSLALERAGIPDNRQRRKAVAKMFTVSTESVRKWLCGESIPETKRIGVIAGRLGVRGEWLLTGRGPMSESETPRDIPGTPNTGPAPEVQGMVPLISWVQAGRWSEVIDNFEPGDAEAWLPSMKKPGPHAFALRVEGESMYNPGGGKSYADGDVIFVDPDRRADHGSMIVVRLEDEQKSTFKQLIIESNGEMRLKALNPDWKPRYIEIDSNATICGVVYGKWVDE